MHKHQATELRLAMSKENLKLIHQGEVSVRGKEPVNPVLMSRVAIYRAVRQKASTSSGGTIPVYLPGIIKEAVSAQIKLPHCKQRGME
ncbi:hypothetical protein ACFL1N_17390 [Thermodesulfobacteriota bacterium]